MLIINSDIVLSIVQKKINMSISKEISALAKGSENREGLWTARTKNTQPWGSGGLPCWLPFARGPERTGSTVTLPAEPPL